MTYPTKNVQLWQLSLLFLILFLWSLVTVAQGIKVHAALGEPIDQLVSVVNNEVITQSDLLWLLALDPKSIITQVDPHELKRILSVKIDRVLICQEAKKIPGLKITADDVKKEERKIIARFPSEIIFRQRIESIGLTPEELTAIASEQVEIERFTDFRFRSFVIVSGEEINKYYSEIVRPNASKQGIVLPEQVPDENSDLIEKILLEERVSKEIEHWLEITRQRAEIIDLGVLETEIIK